MKKIIAIVVGIGIVAIGYTHTHYTLHDCLVYEMSDGNAFVSDWEGETWFIEGANDLSEGDLIDIKAFNWATANPYDDEVISYRKGN